MCRLSFLSFIYLFFLLYAVRAGWLFVKPSRLISLCASIHVCEISTVLDNPSSLLKMSSCFATLSTMRQSATKPPVSGPLSEAPG